MICKADISYMVHGGTARVLGAAVTLMSCLCADVCAVGARIGCASENMSSTSLTLCMCPVKLATCVYTAFTEYSVWEVRTLYSYLHAVGRAPEELGSIQHSAEQVDCALLDEYLADQLCNRLPCQRHLS